MEIINNSKENVTKEMIKVDTSFSSISLNSDTDSTKKHKYELTSLLKEKLTDLPEILEFIKTLQTHIEKLNKKIHKLKSKKSKRKYERVKTKNNSTQTKIIAKVDVIKGEAKLNHEIDEPKSLAEEITEAAEQALQKTGFVYEETSGMYYDYNSGYYYNAEYGLYYDGNTGTYLKYNQDSQDYEFHSQVEISPVLDEVPKKTKEKTKIKRKGEQRQEKSHASSKREKRSKSPLDEEFLDLEEGECSDDSNNTLINEDDHEQDDTSSDLDLTKQYPPCMRIIIEETNIKTLKQGSLHMITFDGGTLGREGSHSILLPDINTSKHHLKFTYDKENGGYCVIDLGSRNGTILNGKRMSPSKMESDVMEVPHGSKIQIGGTVMLCHVHSGTQTCGHCEPGLIQVKEVEIDKPEIKRSTKTTDYKKQLKQLRKKFGISQWDQSTNPGTDGGYTDRAQVRRVTVGSQNANEKTQSASLTESIPAENKGFKLLSKMGWKEGESLGKDNHGRLEPVEIVSNPGTSGMGNTDIVPTVQISNVDKNKAKVWKKTQERYSQMPDKIEDIFDDKADSYE